VPNEDDAVSAARRVSPAAREGLASDPVIAVPQWILARYNARVLDPALATKVAGEPPIRPTVYIADKLIVSGAASQSIRDELTAAANDKQLRIEPPLVRVELRERYVAAAREAGREDADTLFGTVHELIPVEGAAVVADAWDVLQSFRSRTGASFAAEEPRHVGLDHLLTSTKYIHGSPFVAHDAGPLVASGSYGEPGWGGRQPVRLVGPPPARRSEVPFRRPVVAVLDTGVGEHEWFPLDPETVVHRNQREGKELLGLGDISLTETSGVVEHPLEGVLDPYSGHGTFIAGLIHQECPDADILSVRVMPSEGAVPEHVLLDALKLLVCRQHRALTQGAHNDAIDILCLSLGYYHEQVGDGAQDPLLYEPLRALGEMGVVVVVAAGNDATTRPMFPAAFAPHAGGFVAAPDDACVPVISVGAENPDGSTALFSNDGDWVTCTAPGAAVVSTLPKFNASGQAAYAFRGPHGWRSTIDPDSFGSGFGVWSGTSFAAPVIAGRLARTLVEGDAGSTDDLDPKAALARGWACVRANGLVPK
jgi:hypothetical protein